MHTVHAYQEKASVEEGRGQRKERAKTGRKERRRVTKNSDGGMEEEEKGERFAFPPSLPFQQNSPIHLYYKRLI